MKGSIVDFLNLAIEKPELARALVELAARFDFEFTFDELGEDELDSVSGGTRSPASGPVLTYPGDGSSGDGQDEISTSTIETAYASFITSIQGTKFP